MNTRKIILFLLGVVAAYQLNAQTWTGGGSDDLWTTEDNWDGTAPVANDSLTFDGTAQTSNNNDFSAGTQFNGITFAADSGPWTLNGNAINLAGDIFVSANSGSLRTHVLNMDLAMQSATTAITSRINDNITLNGVLSGTGTLVHSGAGITTLTGENTYSGGTIINSGILSVGNDVNNLGDQALTLNGGTLQVTTAGNFNSVATRTGAGRGLAVGASGGTLNIVDASGNLQVTGVISGSGTLNVTGAGRFTPSNVNNTFSGDYNVFGGATLAVASAAEGSNVRLGSGANFDMDNGTLLFSGGLGGAENTHTRNTALGAGGGTFVLGNTGAQNPIITWNGNISGTGDLTIANSGGNSGEFILGGAVTHTGNTIINSGSTLTLADEGGSMTFVIGANGVNNSILGEGALNLNGVFIFDLASASENLDDSWAIVSHLTLDQNYGPSFSVQGFDNNGDLWTSGIYQFDQATGILTVIPEPATFSFIGGLLAIGVVFLRRRKQLL